MDGGSAAGPPTLARESTVGGMGMMDGEERKPVVIEFEVHSCIQLAMEQIEEDYRLQMLNEVKKPCIPRKFVNFFQSDNFHNWTQSLYNYLVCWKEQLKECTDQTQIDTFKERLRALMQDVARHYSCILLSLGEARHKSRSKKSPKQAHNDDLSFFETTYHFLEVVLERGFDPSEWDPVRDELARVLRSRNFSANTGSSNPFGAFKRPMRVQECLDLRSPMMSNLLPSARTKKMDTTEKYVLGTEKWALAEKKKRIAREMRRQKYEM